MKVDVKVEAPTKSLRKGDGSRLCTGDAREALGGTCDLLGEDEAQRREDVRLGRRKPAQLEGQAHHPLANRGAGQDSIGDVRGLVAHSPRAAARTQAALLAREADEDVVSAAVAVAAHEAPREVGAREVALEGIRHVARQRRGVGRFGVGDEGRVVLAHEAMEDGVVRPPRRVGGRGPPHAPRPARRVPARSCRNSWGKPPWRRWRRHGESRRRHPWPLNAGSRSSGKSRAARFQPTSRPTGPSYATFPKRVPTSPVSVPVIAYVLPSCSYRAGRGRAEPRASHSAISARPVTSHRLHSAGSNTASCPTSPSLASLYAAPNATWTSRRFSSILLAIGALSPRGCSSCGSRRQRARLDAAAVGGALFAIGRK